MSIADTRRHRERYPRTLKRVTDDRESTWHFRARRLWWAYAVLSTRGDAPPMFEAVVLSGVSLYAAQAIIEYCGWEHLLPLAANVDVLEKLSGLGITIKWDGPSCVAWSGYRGPCISTSKVRRTENHQARQSVLTRSLTMRGQPPSTRARGLLPLNCSSINEMCQICL